MGCFTGQAATEYLILLGAALIVMLTVVLFTSFIPSFAYSVEKQRSDDYWLDARPFSVKGHLLVPNKMILELQNTEPVSLTVKGIWLNAISLNFSNHSIPFSWNATSQCSGGGCTMLMRPGQTQIISTVNFTTTPANPCLQGEGTGYELNLTITYQLEGASLENQTGSQYLIGECTRR